MRPALCYSVSSARQLSCCGPVQLEGQAKGHHLSLKTGGQQPSSHCLTFSNCYELKLPDYQYSYFETYEWVLIARFRDACQGLYLPIIAPSSQTF